MSAACNGSNWSSFVGVGACVVAVLGLVACKEREPAPKYEVEPAPTSGEVIPSSPVSGKVRDAEFKLGNARYYVDRRPGFEKVDIHLSAGTGEDPCGKLMPRDASMVWLRRTGSGPVEKGQARIEPEQPGVWEAHYQVRVGRDWEGNGTAAALLVIREVAPDMTLHGDLKACFADKEKSCVAGSFSAKYCPIAIDAPVRGTEAMERPPPGDAGWSWDDAGADAAAGESGGDGGDGGGEVEAGSAP